jgi:predicted RNA-binding Zn ribbon-like protein
MLFKAIILIGGSLGFLYFAKKLNTMANELENLQREVQENNDVMQSAIALINGLKTKLDEAIAGGDMSQVQALSDQLDQNSNALAQAVAANTPSETGGQTGDGNSPQE